MTADYAHRHNDVLISQGDPDPEGRPAFRSRVSACPTPHAAGEPPDQGESEAGAHGPQTPIALMQDPGLESHVTILRTEAGA